MSRDKVYRPKEQAEIKKRQKSALNRFTLAALFAAVTVFFFFALFAFPPAAPLLAKLAFGLLVIAPTIIASVFNIFKGLSAVNNADKIKDNAKQRAQAEEERELETPSQQRPRAIDGYSLPAGNSRGQTASQQPDEQPRLASAQNFSRSGQGRVEPSQNMHRRNTRHTDLSAAQQAGLPPATRRTRDGAFEIGYPQGPRVPTHHQFFPPSMQAGFTHAAHGGYAYDQRRPVPMETEPATANRQNPGAPLAPAFPAEQPRATRRGGTADVDIQQQKPAKAAVAQPARVAARVAQPAERAVDGADHHEPLFVAPPPPPADTALSAAPTVQKTKNPIFSFFSRFKREREIFEPLLPTENDLDDEFAITPNQLSDDPFDDIARRVPTAQPVRPYQAPEPVQDDWVAHFGAEAAPLTAARRAEEARTDAPIITVLNGILASNTTSKTQLQAPIVVDAAGDIVVRLSFVGALGENKSYRIPRSLVNDIAGNLESDPEPDNTRRDLRILSKLADWANADENKHTYLYKAVQHERVKQTYPHLYARLNQAKYSISLDRNGDITLETFGWGKQVRTISSAAAEEVNKILEHNPIISKADLKPKNFISKELLTEAIPPVRALTRQETLFIDQTILHIQEIIQLANEAPAEEELGYIRHLKQKFRLGKVKQALTNLVRQDDFNPEALQPENMQAYINNVAFVLTDHGIIKGTKLTADVLDSKAPDKARELTSYLKEATDSLPLGVSFNTVTVAQTFPEHLRVSNIQAGDTITHVNGVLVSQDINVKARNPLLKTLKTGETITLQRPGTAGNIVATVYASPDAMARERAAEQAAATEAEARRRTKEERVAREALNRWREKARNQAGAPGNPPPPPPLPPLFVANGAQAGATLQASIIAKRLEAERLEAERVRLAQEAAELRLAEEARLREAPQAARIAVDQAETESMSDISSNDDNVSPITHCMNEIMIAIGHNAPNNTRDTGKADLQSKRLQKIKNALSIVADDPTSTLHSMEKNPDVDTNQAHTNAIIACLKQKELLVQDKKHSVLKLTAKLDKLKYSEQHLAMLFAELGKSLTPKAGNLGEGLEWDALAEAPAAAPADQPTENRMSRKSFLRLSGETPAPGNDDDDDDDDDDLGADAASPAPPPPAGQRKAPGGVRRAPTDTNGQPLERRAPGAPLTAEQEEARRTTVRKEQAAREAAAAEAKRAAEEQARLDAEAKKAAEEQADREAERARQAEETARKEQAERQRAQATITLQAVWRGKQGRKVAIDAKAARLAADQAAAEAARLAADQATAEAMAAPFINNVLVHTKALLDKVFSSQNAKAHNPGITPNPKQGTITISLIGVGKQKHSKQYSVEANVFDEIKQKINDLAFLAVSDPNPSFNMSVETTEVIFKTLQAWAKASRHRLIGSILSEYENSIILTKESIKTDQQAISMLEAQINEYTTKLQTLDPNGAPYHTQQERIEHLTRKSQNLKKLTILLEKSIEISQAPAAAPATAAGTPRVNIPLPPSSPPPAQAAAPATVVFATQHADEFIRHDGQDDDDDDFDDLGANLTAYGSKNQKTDPTAPKAENSLPFKTEGLSAAQQKLAQKAQAAEDAKQTAAKRAAEAQAAKKELASSAAKGTTTLLNTIFITQVPQPVLTSNPDGSVTITFEGKHKETFTVPTEKTVLVLTALERQDESLALRVLDDWAQKIDQKRNNRQVIIDAIHSHVEWKKTFSSQPIRHRTNVFDTDSNTMATFFASTTRPATLASAATPPAATRPFNTVNKGEFVEITSITSQTRVDVLPGDLILYVRTNHNDLFESQADINNVLEGKKTDHVLSSMVVMSQDGTIYDCEVSTSPEQMPKRNSKLSELITSSDRFTRLVTKAQQARSTQQTMAAALAKAVPAMGASALPPPPSYARPSGAPVHKATQLVMTAVAAMPTETADAQTLKLLNDIFHYDLNTHEHKVVFENNHYAIINGAEKVNLDPKFATYVTEAFNQRKQSVEQIIGNNKEFIISQLKLAKLTPNYAADFKVERTPAAKIPAATSTPTQPAMTATSVPAEPAQPASSSTSPTGEEAATSTNAAEDAPGAQQMTHLKSVFNHRAGILNLGGTYDVIIVSVKGQPRYAIKNQETGLTSPALHSSFVNKIIGHTPESISANADLCRRLDDILSQLQKKETAAKPATASAAAAAYANGDNPDTLVDPMTGVEHGIIRVVPISDFDETLTFGMVYYMAIAVRKGNTQPVHGYKFSETEKAMITQAIAEMDGANVSESKKLLEIMKRNHPEQWQKSVAFINQLNTRFGQVYIATNNFVRVIEEYAELLKAGNTKAEKDAGALLLNPGVIYGRDGRKVDGHLTGFIPFDGKNGHILAMAEDGHFNLKQVTPLLVDDSQGNITAARAAGYVGIRVDPNNLTITSTNAENQEVTSQVVENGNLSDAFTAEIRSQRAALQKKAATQRK